MSQVYKSILNKHYFIFTNEGDNRGDDGVRITSEFSIPALAPLPNGESKTGILRVHQFYIGLQTHANNVAVSNFILQIGGLSIRPTLHHNVGTSNRISIPNGTPHQLNAAGAFANIASVSGSELANPYEVICGNPSGNQFSLKIMDEDGEDIAANAGNLDAMTMSFVFSIELIDPDDDQNF